MTLKGFGIVAGFGVGVPLFIAAAVAILQDRTLGGDESLALFLIGLALGVVWADTEGELN